MLNPRGVPEIDLGGLAEGYDLKLEVASSERPEEVASRLRVAEAEANHARWRVTVVYAVAALAVTVIAAVCVYVILDPRFSTDDKAWARPILTALGAGLLGFVVKSKLEG